MCIVRQRFLQSTRKPGFVDNRKDRYPLYYHGEHAPNPNSRVRLSGERDALGLPRAVVDLRFTDVDANSVVESHALLDAWLRRKGIGRLDYFDAAEERSTRVLEQACDGYHQIGLTRMSSSPRQGIVDGNCRVHDVDNLFVASSSVFPTSGQANPTFLAVAMAARLAEHIEARLIRVPTISGSAASPRGRAAFGDRERVQAATDLAPCGAGRTANASAQTSASAAVVVRSSADSPDAARCPAAKSA
jgi:GMC oxidoreductase